MPAGRLLSNGVRSSELQLATRTTVTKGLFEVNSVVAVYENDDDAGRVVRKLQDDEKHHRQDTARFHTVPGKGTSLIEAIH